jgi:glycosyltransferase involved in cell wall biosynthesis
MAAFSVIIPLFNKAFSIKETLTSVLQQTYTDFEVIVIDDGSTDDGFALVSQFTDARILLVQQPNLGAAAARNAGIEKATGELIAFLDADDYWHPHHLEALFKLHADFPNCGLYCSRYQTKISEKTILNPTYSNSIPDNYRGVLSDYFETSLIHRVSLTSACAIPKVILKNDFVFNTQVSSGQDLELFTKIGIRYPVALHNEYTVLYHFEIPNSLAKTPILEKKLMDFSQFATAEATNKSLKKFLDVYRLEYALHFKMAGATEKSNFYLKDITTKIPIKTKLLLVIPGFILRLLLAIKQLLKKNGIDFSVYH